MINDKVKNVIFFSISVASKSCWFRCFHDKISDEILDNKASGLLNSKDRFEFLESLSIPKTKESFALKILLENILATTTSLISGTPNELKLKSLEIIWTLSPTSKLRSEASELPIMISSGVKNLWFFLRF